MQSEKALPIWLTVFKLNLLYVSITFYQVHTIVRVYQVHTIWEEEIGDKVLIELKTDAKPKEIDPYCCSVKIIVGLSQQLKTVEHISRETSRHLFLPDGGGRSNWPEFSFAGLQTIPYPCWRIGGPTNFKFQKSPPCYRYENERIHNFAYEFRAKERESLSSDKEINLLIHESSETDSKVAKPKKKKRTPITTQKMNFSIKDFFSKCEQIRRNLRI